MKSIMKLLNTLYKLINENPNHIVLIVNDKTYTYSDIKKSINVWKSRLEFYGVSQRSKVIIHMSETIDIVGAYFALCELNCVIIPIDTSAKQSTIYEVIKSSKSHFVISLQKLNLNDLQQTTLQSLGYTLYRTSYKEKDTTSDIMQFLYTSGTTGLPKCVMFSKENIANNIFNLASELSLSKDDVIYTPISFMLPSALNTVLLPALLSGTKVFVSGSTVPSNVLRNIIKQKVTVFFAVPFYYKLLVSNGLCTDITWENVRLCLTSSAYLSEEDFNCFYEKSKKALHSIYCSSEAGTIAYNDSEDIDSLRKFVGRPLNTCEVSLININADGTGEIVVKSGMTSEKYYENEELNKEVYRNGWIKTGDIGFIHKNRYLEIKGRISESINIAGHLVNPLEVEKIIQKIDAVKDVVVYKYISNSNNDMLGAKVMINEGTSIMEKEIIDYCKAALPNYKVPKKVQFVDNIDTGRYGKKKRDV